MIYRLCALLTTKADKKIIELIAMDVNAFCDHIKKGSICKPLII